MKKHALVIGSGVASTAYVSVLDFNKIKTSVIGSPYELKEIQNLKKNKKIKLFNLIISENTHLVKKKSHKQIIRKVGGQQWTSGVDPCSIPAYRCLHRTWDTPRAPGAQKKKKKNYTTRLDLYTIALNSIKKCKNNKYHL